MAATGVTVADMQAELLLIRTAISDILKTGQSYNRQGLSLTHANLGELRKSEQFLIRSLTRSDGGVVAVIEAEGSQYQGGTTSWED